MKTFINKSSEELDFLMSPPLTLVFFTYAVKKDFFCT